jgi:hypothetical protein
MTLPAPLFPLATEDPPAPRRELLATLRRIDGWGQGAWREIYRSWRLRHAVLVVDDLEPGIGRDPDDRVISALLVVEDHVLGDDPAHHDATADWVLRTLWSGLMPRLAVTATTHRPGASVQATNACLFAPPRPGQRAALLLRLLVRLPMAGMCCDGKRFIRLLRQLDGFAAQLRERRARAGLAAHRRAVAVQRALRAALPGHGLVAFIGAGARLARGPGHGPAAHCRPLRVARAQRVTIDLGTLGRQHGLGIRTGVTAIAGAPYHGKSTLLQAIAAGRDDHPPGDGRELVVADASALLVQAEDGRRIKRQDLDAFFARLPGASARGFSTTRASGATSMAASLLQGVAAGCRLLAIDEDTAASNFLTIDPVMRALLGTALRGTTTLLELLPALAVAGVSTLLVAGSNAESLAASDRVLLMEHYQPRDATAAARRLLRRAGAARGAGRPRAFPLPGRVLRDQSDCLFGPRHFLAVDATEAERPLLDGAALDLRRCGWELDTASVRGALAAAACCCRLAAGQPVTLAALRSRYAAFIAERGVRGLDPFDTQLITLPPWQLVVTVLERLPRPELSSTTA